MRGLLQWISDWGRGRDSGERGTTMRLANEDRRLLLAILFEQRRIAAQLQLIFPVLRKITNSEKVIMSVLDEIEAEVASNTSVVGSVETPGAEHDCENPGTDRRAGSGRRRHHAASVGARRHQIERHEARRAGQHEHAGAAGACAGADANGRAGCSWWRRCRLIYRAPAA